MSPDPLTLGRLDSWAGVRVVVAGFGPAGFAAADNLLHLGATVTAVDERTAEEFGEASAEVAERAELLGVLGASIALGAGTTAVLPDEVDLLVVSPDWRTDAPLVVQAHARAVPVWGEVELAWRLRHPEHDTPWLVVAGSGRARTARLTETILLAGGVRTVAAGDGGLPLVEAVMDPEPWDVLPVALTALQLRGTTSMSPLAAVVLDTAAEHEEFYAGLAEDVPAALAADLGRAYTHTRVACVYDVEDASTEDLVREAEVVEGARAVGITLGMPGVSMLGLVEDLLVDRAFIEERSTSAAELCAVGDLPDAEPAHVRQALAAAALARAAGATQAAVRDGLSASS
ncbi:hypothetical protein [Nocardioides bruguierae]|uniref:Uncharacterized protein n=1 Tax=Nocardioides bruguierae TaxID=2945102 RepID=A0A9X2D971_9ACTN|nr:hypothetical protein [Nocardioides bruguierae]MCM0621618.1 hypothetical protein [Nocardioides bruguierae]